MLARTSVALRGAVAIASRSACAPAFTAARCMSTTVRFTKDHEYARVDGKVATCGITDFAQTQLGDVVYVSLPEVGASFKKGYVGFWWL